MAGAATNWGYQPDGYNANDVPYTYQGTKIHHSDMTGANLLKDNTAFFQSDLAPVGSCVVDALAVAVAYLQAVVKYDNIPSPPSRRFMYYNGRAIGLMGDSKGGQIVWPNGIADSGVSLRNAIQGINSFGLVSETQYAWGVQDFPGLGSVVVGINDTPSASIYAEASNTPTFNSYRLDSPPSPETKNAETPTDMTAEGHITLLHIRECLTEGMPVMFAFQFYWSTFKTTPPANGDDGYPTIARVPAGRKDVGPEPGTKYQISVGLVVGFEHEKTRLLVKSMFVSGPPYFWMSYNWILDAEATAGFWMMRAPSNEAASHAVIETPSPSDLSQQVATIVGLPSSPSGAAPNTTIATVLRQNIGPNGDCTDVFWKSTLNSISRSYYYTEKGSWQFANVFIGYFTTVMEAVAAASPAPGVMDLFWIFSDGSVNHSQTLGNTLTNEASGGGPAIWGTVTQVAPAGSANPNAGLAATSQVIFGYGPGGPGSVQVYWIGADGSVECANNMANNTVWVQSQVAPPGSATPLSNIAAGVDVAYDPSVDSNNMSVWWIAPDTTVMGMVGVWQNGVNMWESVSLQNPEGDGCALLNSSIAVKHFRGLKWVFYISPTGVVRAMANDGDVSFSSMSISSAALARTDSRIGVTAQFSDENITVFWVSPSGSLMAGVTSSPGPATALTTQSFVDAMSPMAGLTFGGANHVCFKLWSGEMAMATYTPVRS